LGVGVDSANKNIKSVVEAFHQAGLGDTVLVLTGARDQRVHGHFNKINADRVCMIGHVPDRELRALYEHALALVFPSLYEGFGLPPIEAMTCGCPVVISEQPALVEVCGEAALHCPATDVTAISRHLRRLNDDAGLRAHYAAAGRERVRRFTWAATAQKLLDLCLQVGARRAT
jgi:glycosyltransferase involved in cell wall biosynthesis